ncbi:MAG: M1 family metallopeptidase, partial [Acidobacteriota bacterium]|nr:M1 family metallopeptidase [Acidobacteriota bacterium]
MKLLKTCFSYFLCVCSIIIIAEKNTIIAEEREPSLCYQIWVELDDQDKMLYGKEEIVWVNKSQDEVQDMWFHLYYNAFKNEKSAVIEESKESIKQFGIKVKDGEWGWIDVTSIYLADGRDLTPTMEFVTQDEPIHPDDQTVMRVIFPEPVMPGEEVHIFLDFQSKIPRTILRSGYYKDSYFIAQWFPKPGVYEEGKGWNCHAYHLNSEFFADFANFTVHITVPEKFVVGASGKQIKANPDKESGKTTYTYYQKNIHDFAWTADPDFIKIERDFIADEEITNKEYQEVARMLQLPLDKVKLPDVKMILLINPEHKDQIERHFNALKAALKYYGLWYGPYPYETVTMVDPPFRTRSGGMEYPTLFTAGTSVLTSKDVLSPEGVIIHEFGHGYWYGLCANNEFEEAWLDEGINTYSTGKVIAKAYGQGTVPSYFNRIPMNWFFKFPKYYDYELDRTLGIHVVELDPITIYSWKFF